MKAELNAAVAASGSHLRDIHGIGPAGAARILADVGDIARFLNRAHFASWTGTAPSMPPAASTSRRISARSARPLTRPSTKPRAS